MQSHEEICDDPTRFCPCESCPTLREMIIRWVGVIAFLLSVVQLGISTAIFDFGHYVRNDSHGHVYPGAWWAALVSLIASTINIYANSNSQYFSAVLASAFALVAGGIGTSIDKMLISDITKMITCSTHKEGSFSSLSCDRYLEHENFQCICETMYLGEYGEINCFYFVLTSNVSKKNCAYIQGGLYLNLMAEVRFQIALFVAFVILVILNYARYRPPSAIAPEFSESDTPSPSCCINCWYPMNLISAVINYPYYDNLPTIFNGPSRDPVRIANQTQLPNNNANGTITNSSSLLSSRTNHANNNSSYHQPVNHNGTIAPSNISQDPINPNSTSNYPDAPPTSSNPSRRLYRNRNRIANRSRIQDLSQPPNDPIVEANPVPEPNSNSLNHELGQIPNNNSNNTAVGAVHNSFFPYFNRTPQAVNISNNYQLANRNANIENIPEAPALAIAFAEPAIATAVTDSTNQLYPMAEVVYLVDADV